MVDNITLRIKKIKINEDIDNDINKIISKVGKINLSTLNEIDDVIKFSDLSNIYMKKLSSKYTFSNNDKKKLFQYYQELYKKILIYHKHISFDSDNEEYTNLDNSIKNNLKYLKIYFKKMYLYVILSKREITFSKNKHIHTLKIISNFFNKLKLTLTKLDIMETNSSENIIFYDVKF